MVSHFPTLAAPADFGPSTDHLDLLDSSYAEARTTVPASSTQYQLMSPEMLESVIDKALQKHQEAHRAEISRLLQVIGGLEDKVDLLLEAPTGADRDRAYYESQSLADPEIFDWSTTPFADTWVPPTWSLADWIDDTPPIPSITKTWVVLTPAGTKRSMVSNINSERLSLSKGFVPLEQVDEDGPPPLELIDDFGTVEQEDVQDSEDEGEYADMPSLVDLEEEMRRQAIARQRHEAVERVVRAAFERARAGEEDSELERIE